MIDYIIGFIFIIINKYIGVWESIQILGILFYCIPKYHEYKRNGKLKKNTPNLHIIGLIFHLIITLIIIIIINGIKYRTYAIIGLIIGFAFTIFNLHEEIFEEDFKNLYKDYFTESLYSINFKDNASKNTINDNILSSMNNNVNSNISEKNNDNVNNNINYQNITYNDSKNSYNSINNNTSNNNIKIVIIAGIIIAILMLLLATS